MRLKISWLAKHTLVGYLLHGFSHRANPSSRAGGLEKHLHVAFAVNCTGPEHI
jgi:hypothetical protein